jgi:toxin YoeB
LQTIFEIYWSFEAAGQLKKIKKNKLFQDLGTHLKRLTLLIETVTINPFKGIGQPEALKHYYPKCWSRRINKKDRLVYQFEKNTITIVSIIGHYE